MGPPRKKRKTETNPVVLSFDDIGTSSKKRIIELDSDGDEVDIKPKVGPFPIEINVFLQVQRVKLESSPSSDEDSEASYDHIHAGYDLDNSEIVHFIPTPLSVYAE